MFQVHGKIGVNGYFLTNERLLFLARVKLDCRLAQNDS